MASKIKFTGFTSGSTVTATVRQGETTAGPVTVASWGTPS